MATVRSVVFWPIVVGMVSSTARSGDPEEIVDVIIDAAPWGSGGNQRETVDPALIRRFPD